MLIGKSNRRSVNFANRSDKPLVYYHIYSEARKTPYSKQGIFVETAVPEVVHARGIKVYSDGDEKKSS